MEGTDRALKVENMKFYMALGLGWNFQGIDFYGILGLSPRDESAGPLLVEYLYDQGSIPAK